MRSLHFSRTIKNSLIDTHCITLACLAADSGTVVTWIEGWGTDGMLSRSFRVAERLACQTPYIGTAAAMAARDHKECIVSSSTEKSLKIRFISENTETGQLRRGTVVSTMRVGSEAEEARAKGSSNRKMRCGAHKRGECRRQRGKVREDAELTRELPVTRGQNTISH
jgi:hypothetical protein